MLKKHSRVGECFFLSKFKMKDNKLKREQQEPSELNEMEKTDSRILLGMGIKFVFVYLVLLMSDVLLDTLMAVFDFIVEIIHILIEVFEVLAEEGLEMILQTEHQQSEMIIFNFALIIVLIVLYYFIRALPHLIIALEKQLLKKVKVYWVGQVQQWKLHSIALKLKLVLVYMTGILGLTMLVG